jgi:hypothetical protein
MPRLSLGLGVQNIRKVGGGGGGPPPSGLPTATTNTITLQSGGAGYPIFVEDGAQFGKQDIGYFGDFGDYKLVWSGSRWEMLGDNSSLIAYNTTSGQTTNYFPDQGNWFDFFDQPASLIFVGS